MQVRPITRIAASGSDSPRRSSLYLRRAGVLGMDKRCAAFRRDLCLSDPGGITGNRICRQLCRVHGVVILSGHNGHHDVDHGHRSPGDQFVWDRVADRSSRRRANGMPCTSPADLIAAMILIRGMDSFLRWQKIMFAAAMIGTLALLYVLHSDPSVFHMILTRHFTGTDPIAALDSEIRTCLFGVPGKSEADDRVDGVAVPRPDGWGLLDPWEGNSAQYRNSVCRDARQHGVQHWSLLLSHCWRIARWLFLPGGGSLQS